MKENCLIPLKIQLGIALTCWVVIPLAFEGNVEAENFKFLYSNKRELQSKKYYEQDDKAFTKTLNQKKVINLINFH